MSDYLAAGLGYFFLAAAALAAADIRHILAARDTAALKARDEAVTSFRQGFLIESFQAVREAADRLLNTRGDPRSRAIQLRRTIGLSVAQSDSLRIMRDALMAITDEPSPRAATRNRDAAAILNRHRGRLSAPQLSLLRKAAADNIDRAEAERRLDRHARALRRVRVKAVAGDTIHAFTEAAKQTAWRIAQRAGVLPRDQRRFWRTAGDERVRHAHAQVPGMNPQGVLLDQPFATPLGNRQAPPLEIGCRCRVVLKRPA